MNGQQPDGTLRIEKVAPQLSFDPSVHEYTYGDVVLPSVTQILEILMDKAHYTEAARLRGEYVHLACQLYDEGDLDFETLDPAIQPYLDQYIEWRRETGWKWSSIETPMCDPGHRFAGKPDRICMEPEKAILDIKTGAIERWHSLQTAGYAAMTGDPFAYRRYSIYLAPYEGLFAIMEFPKKNLATDLAAFHSCLNIYNWRRTNGR